MRAGKYCLTIVLVPLTFAAGGCYEDSGSTAPSQTAAPVTGQNEGPITSMGHSGGGSALGGAKRTAENIVDRAEAKSREVAEEAPDADDAVEPVNPEDE